MCNCNSSIAAVFLSLSGRKGEWDLRSVLSHWEHVVTQNNPESRRDCFKWNCDSPVWITSSMGGLGSRDKSFRNFWVAWSCSSTRGDCSASTISCVMTPCDDGDVTPGARLATCDDSGDPVLVTISSWVKKNASLLRNWWTCGQINTISKLCASKDFSKLNLHYYLPCFLWLL